MRDSAGVSIVESAGPDWDDGQEWRLASGPAVRIGALDGAPEEQLFQTTGAVRLSDGRIAVANAGSHELRFTFPAFAGLQVDPSGHLWIRPYPVPAEERTSWQVFDPEGRLLGEVVFPAEFRPTEIGEDYILGLRRDELDVEYVELYALEKR